MLPLSKPILAVLGLRSMLGARLSPAWRVGLWMLVGVKLLLPACIPAGFGLGAWLQSPVVATARATFPEAASQISAQPVAAVPEIPAAPAAAPGFQFPIPSLSLAATLIWLAGAVAVLGLALLRQCRFEKSLRSMPQAKDARLLSLLAEAKQLAGLHHPVTVLLLPAASTPAVIGLRAPRLLLPQDWQTRFDDSALRHVLLHELLHVRHHDLVWNWAALVVQSLHWFNPLVWIIGARFQADRELRCDAAVLRLLSPEDRLSYGRTLLRIQETFFAPPALAGLAPCVRNHPALLQRITMIARPNRNRPWLQAVFILAFGLMAGYAFTTVRAAEEKPLPPKDRSREGERTANPAEPDSIENQEKRLKELVSKAGSKEVTLVRSESTSHGVVFEGEATSFLAFTQFKKILTTHPELSQQRWDIPAPITDSNGKVQFRVEAYILQKIDGQSEMAEGVKKPGMGDHAGAQKPGQGDREGAKKEGPRDGERTRTGARDGDSKKTGMRDGERPKTGSRDGGRAKEGAQDGDNNKGGMRDGERRESGARDGDQARERTEKKSAASPSSQTITLHVIDNGDTVVIGDEKIPLNRLRGHLQSFVPEHPGARVIVTGAEGVRLGFLYDVMDAVRDNGNKNVGLGRE